ncbi:HAD-IA family hydrolase [Vibrio tapetis subsp. quintayensis]|uniref:HAD-IA family hydrolase n=1 Tax=Vibrio tapetis TaxID=52443 RepID=UPI0025B2CFBD|nr:HAD-IA family hydrolase [Vibrio tapetis]MDN3681191.1 HAD-IA family hydrolase [Vibrio tapetis subsp. quintayensis]
MAEKTQCVIFDCEGTLVDSESLCCQALVDVFAQYDCTVSLVDALKHFQGGKPVDVLQEACDRYHLTVSLDELEPLYRERKHDLYEAKLKAMPGVRSLLDDLNKADVAVCIAGNSEKDKIEHALELTGLASYFNNSIFSAFETNTWKPDPDLLHYAALNMGLSAQECIYVDDTLKGVHAGVGAGMRTYYFRPNESEVVIDHPLVSTISSISQLIPEILLPHSETTA